MPTIIIKNGTGVPPDGQLREGELGLDIEGGKLYYGKKDSNEVLRSYLISGNGSSDGIFIKPDYEIITIMNSLYSENNEIVTIEEVEE